jgi:hypothetical protein
MEKAIAGLIDYRNTALAEFCSIFGRAIVTTCMIWPSLLKKWQRLKTPIIILCFPAKPQGSAGSNTIVTWLILPVVICLSQRLSHACLSISTLYCETANGSLNQL